MSFMYGRLVSLAFIDPLEFVDRIRAICEVRLERILRKRAAYEALPPDHVFACLNRNYVEITGGRGAGFSGDISYVSQTSATPAAIPDQHDADPQLANFIYKVTRLLQPSVVIETGVAHGSTSAAILQALDENQRGELHSIDLPPLRRGADAEVGVFVPDSLRSRWTLHRGTSRRVLPKLLADIGPVDIFLHDSLHTKWNIAWELAAATPHLSPLSVVIADDIESNDAFGSWTESVRPAFHAVAQASGKNSLFGVALLERPRD